MACLAAMGLALTACASAPRAKLVRVTAASSPLGQSAADANSAAAGAAIDRRDYGLALERLQAARTARSDDIRVLNAFGVVYDKLGRFDLSARYYGQARALDPASSVVAENLGYSRFLQGLADRPPGKGVPPPSPLANVQAPSGPVIRLAAMRQRPLIVINATGRPNGADGARAGLLRIGWSAPRQAVIGPPEARSIIRYAPADISTAKALARTLPKGVILEVCASGPVNVRLIVGQDAAGWPSAFRGPERRRG